MAFQLTVCFIGALLVSVGPSLTFAVNESDDIVQTFKIPEGGGYKNRPKKDGVDWYKPIRGFIEGIAPGPTDLPIDAFTDLIIKKTRDPKETGLEILKMEVGIIIFIVIGLLFVLIFAVSGFVAACCLCCSSKKVDIPDDGRRHCLNFFYVVFLLFTLLGILYMFSSSNLLHNTLMKIPTHLEDNLDDIITFVNNTRQQLEYIPKEAFPGTAKRIEEQIQEIETKLSGEGQLEDDVKWPVLEKSLKNFQTDMTQATNVMTHILDFQSKIEQFAEEIKNYQETKCQSSSTPPPSPDCTELAKSNVNVPKVIEKKYADGIQDWKDDVDKLAETLRQQKSKFQNEMRNEVHNALKEVNKTFESIQDRLQEIVWTIDNTTISMERSMMDVKESAHSALVGENVKIIYDIIYKVMLAVSAILLVAWLFFTCGLIGGGIFFRKNKKPEERTCCSSCSGCLILLGMTLIFMFASLFWLATTVLFAVGSHVDIFVCNPLYDEPDYRLLSKYIEIETEKEEGDLLGNLYLHNSNISIRLKDILSGCKNKSTVYEVLRLKFIVKIEEKLNRSIFEDPINTVKANFNVSRMFLPNLTDLSSTFSMVEMKNLAQLNKSYVFKGFSDNLLQQLKGDQLVADLENIISQKTTLKTAEKTLEELDTNLRSTSILLQKKTEQVFDIFTSFIDVIYDFKTFTEDSMMNDIARCDPLWNVYDSFRRVLCRNLLDPLNGFWFGLGWSLFFFCPLLFVAVRVSQFLRVMKSKDKHYEWQ